MDRFILAPLYIQLYYQRDLKSNMDRFIYARQFDRKDRMEI